jgi:cobalt-zinc-cadmium efflux system membrane fusion protein
MKMSRSSVMGLVGAVVLSCISIWVSAGFTREPPPRAPEPAGMRTGASDVSLAPDAPQWRALKLGPVRAAATHFSDPVPARVKIDEARASKVGTPLAGRATTVSVELGQSVKTGDPLFSVASADIATLRAERDKAAVDLEVSKAQLSRITAMVEARAIPAKDQLEASQQLKQVQLSLRAAQSKIASLKVSPRADNEFTLVSPRDGVVVEKNVLPSEQLNPEATLVTVADLSTVWIVAELFEADAAGITRGTPVKITSPSLPDFAAETTVGMISSVVDPLRHTVPVRVELPNPDGLLKPNIYAQMRFSVKPPEGAVEIASMALVSDGSHQYVYVEETKGKFVRREVAAGPAHEGKVFVTRGLVAGEAVVEEGALLLDNQISLSH